MDVTRSVQISCDNFSDLNEALAWVIKHHDREFEDCPAFTIQVEKNQRCRHAQETGNPADWEPFYTATINGVFEENDDEDDEAVDTDTVNSEDSASVNEATEKE